MAGLEADAGWAPAPTVDRRSRVPATLLWGAAIVLVVLALAIAGPWIAPYPYDEMQIMARLKPPSLAHWFGTDDYGRDVLSRTLIGARLSLLMGLGATAFCLLVGVPIGLYAGYRRGRVEEAVMRTMDVLMSFPPILLGLLVLSVTPPALWKTYSRRRGRHVPAIAGSRAP
jgi:peptide/nickel transport system permease protein